MRLTSDNIGFGRQPGARVGTRPDLPDCQPVILILAFWPRICNCTGSRPAR
jgi:hypothetical protein